MEGGAFKSVTELVDHREQYFMESGMEGAITSAVQVVGIGPDIFLRFFTRASRRIPGRPLIICPVSSQP